MRQINDGGRVMRFFLSSFSAGWFLQSGLFSVRVLPKSGGCGGGRIRMGLVQICLIRARAWTWSLEFMFQLWGVSTQERFTVIGAVGQRFGVLAQTDFFFVSLCPEPARVSGGLSEMFLHCFDSGSSQCLHLRRRVVFLGRGFAGVHQ